MLTPEAKGERFCCANGHLWLTEVAAILAEHGYSVPRRLLPDWLFRVVALLDAQTRVIVPELGKREDIDSTKVKAILGWTPREAAETILDTAKSLREISRR